MESNKYISGMILLGAIAVGLYIWSFIMLSNNMSSTNDLDQIKRSLPKVWGITIAASIALSLAGLFYFLYDSDKAITILLIITCLTFGLSYSSMCFTILSKLGIA